METGNLHEIYVTDEGHVGIKIQLNDEGLTIVRAEFSPQIAEVYAFELSRLADRAKEIRFKYN